MSLASACEEASAHAVLRRLAFKFELVKTTKTTATLPISVEKG